MEFRLMVPVLPLLMVLFAWGLFTIADEVAVPMRTWWPSSWTARRSPRRRRAVVAVAVLGSVFHAATFWGAGGIQPVSNLSIHMTRETLTLGVGVYDVGAVAEDDELSGVDQCARRNAVRRLAELEPTPPLARDRALGLSRVRKVMGYRPFPNFVKHYSED